MERINADRFDDTHVVRWLQTTAQYLFHDRAGTARGRDLSGGMWRRCDEARAAKRGAKSADDAFAALKTDSRGAQLRFMARVRGRPGRLVKRGPHDESALQELAHAVEAHIAFVASHPEVPRRMLRWSLDPGSGRIHRRIRTMMNGCIDRLSRILCRARERGEIRATIEPHAAALLLVCVIQSFAFRMSAGVQSPQHALDEGAAVLALYLEGIASANGFIDR